MFPVGARSVKIAIRKNINFRRSVFHGKKHRIHYIQHLLIAVCNCHNKFPSVLKLLLASGENGYHFKPVIREFLCSLKNHVQKNNLFVIFIRKLHCTGQLKEAIRTQWNTLLSEELLKTVKILVG